MSEPDYVICVNCETPVYEFEYKGDTLIAAMCLTCGNDNPEEFMTEADLEDS